MSWSAMFWVERDTNGKVKFTKAHSKVIDLEPVEEKHAILEEVFAREVKEADKLVIQKYTIETKKVWKLPNE